jgi:hypothetical protein
VRRKKWKERYKPEAHAVSRPSSKSASRQHSRRGSVSTGATPQCYTKLHLRDQSGVAIVLLGHGSPSTLADNSSGQSKKQTPTPPNRHFFFNNEFSAESGPHVSTHIRSKSLSGHVSSTGRRSRNSVSPSPSSHVSVSRSKPDSVSFVSDSAPGRKNSASPMSPLHSQLQEEPQHSRYILRGQLKPRGSQRSSIGDSEEMPLVRSTSERTVTHHRRIRSDTHISSNSRNRNDGDGSAHSTSSKWVPPLRSLSAGRDQANLQLAENYAVQTMRAANKATAAAALAAGQVEQAQTEVATLASK